MNRTVAPPATERRKATPRVGSSESRSQEMSMEAQAMLARHARETLELCAKLRGETAALGDRRAA